MNGKRRLKMKQLTRLFIPICLETLFYMLSGMVDTLMLSAVGDYAVGAVGTANSYIGILDRKSTRLNSSHANESRMPSSA